MPKLMLVMADDVNRFDLVPNDRGPGQTLRVLGLADTIDELLEVEAVFDQREKEVCDALKARHAALAAQHPPGTDFDLVRVDGGTFGVHRPHLVDLMPSQLDADGDDDAPDEPTDLYEPKPPFVRAKPQDG